MRKWIAVAAMMLAPLTAKAQVATYTYYGCGLFGSCHTATLRVNEPAFPADFNLQVRAEFSADPGSYTGIGVPGVTFMGSLMLGPIELNQESARCQYRDNGPQRSCTWSDFASDAKLTFLPTAITAGVGYGGSQGMSQPGSTGGGGPAYTESVRLALVTAPEPSTYALMAAGLAVLAGVARRRQGGTRVL